MKNSHHFWLFLHESIYQIVWSFSLQFKLNDERQKNINMRKIFNYWITVYYMNLSTQTIFNVLNAIFFIFLRLWMKSRSVKCEKKNQIFFFDNINYARFIFIYSSNEWTSDFEHQINFWTSNDSWFQFCFWFQSIFIDSDFSTISEISFFLFDQAKKSN